MKQLKGILFVFNLFVITSCNAQIIPVEDFHNYKSTRSIPDGAHVKDVNYLLDKFTGTWKGSFENNTFELFIKKITKEQLFVKWDKLEIRYTIYDTNGNIVADNTAPDIKSYHVINGRYLQEDSNDSYLFDYTGLECGQGVL